MKKMMIILSFVIIALLAQCKKQEITETIEPSNGIQMVLKTDNDSSKTIFDPNGAVSWDTNETIYVVTNGKCVGYVSNGSGGGSTFTGILNGITSNGTYDFHFYYVGRQDAVWNQL